MSWLLVGGAGYIGAHVARSLRSSGRDVVVLDDLSTGLRERVPDDVSFVEGSVLDQELVERTLREHAVIGVVHLAAKKAVAESVARPLWYYEENVGGILSLTRAMLNSNVSRIVYSSSAAVYGMTEADIIVENSPTAPISPYGETKLIGEWVVRDVAEISDLSWVSLRYFNVAGAGSSELGDTSVANLIPIVLRSYGAGEPAKVFGDDYPTPDGTCLRDYIHVADLADAHTAAAALTEKTVVGEVVNIGTGKGSSVLEVIDSVSTALGEPVQREIVPRRPGDPPALVASADRGESVLGWRASHTLDDMTRSAAQAAGLI